MKLKLKFIYNESRQHYTLSALDLEVLDLGVCMHLKYTKITQTHKSSDIHTFITYNRSTYYNRNYINFMNLSYFAHYFMN